jgi:fatty-acyl-CoA synthase
MMNLSPNGSKAIIPVSQTTTLIQVLQEHVTVNPTAPLIVMRGHDDEITITRQAFYDQCLRYASALQQSGVGAGDLVALVLQHGEDVMVGFWGAMMLGAIPSIFPFLSDKLDKTIYFNNLSALVEHEQIRVVITNDALYPALTERLQAIPTLKAILTPEHLRGMPETSFIPDTMADEAGVAFLQHSSGSTGLQKGVMLSHQAVLAHVRSYAEAIRLRPDDVVVSWLPLYHDMGLIAGFVMPILMGLKLVLLSPFHWVRDPKSLLWAVHDHHGTLSWLPNFAYNLMATRIRPADLEGLNLSSWRAVVNCSEPVQAESHRLFLERFQPYGLRENALTACYAMAENTFAVSQSGIDAPLNVDVVSRSALTEQRTAQPVALDRPDAQKFVSNGKPIKDCRVEVRDDDKNRLPERHVGEIWVQSEFMLDGYYARPDLNALAVVDGWYQTGDMGYIADGEIYITGRKKDLIIVGGKNIYPQDIEHLLNEIDGVQAGRGVVFGVWNDELGTEDIAIVVEAIESIDTADRRQIDPIIRQIRGKIATQTDVSARYIRVVPKKWLIKTSSGKIARGANRDKFLSES